MKILNCRSCGSPDLRLILDLGVHPVADALLPAEALAQPEKKYPLCVVLCANCTLLQVTETIPAAELYPIDYPYFSSASPARRDSAAEIAMRMIEKAGLHAESLAVEVASNDGYLLRNFVERGIPCLGIDPAVAPAQKAREAGVPTLVGFFNRMLADSLVAQGRRADVIFANNVIAHVDSINDFVSGFAALLKPNGTAVFECAYAVDLIESCEFDTIYHEHLFYHTLLGLTPLVERHGLFINDAEWLPIHGGSLRVFVGREPTQTDRLQRMIAEEKALGVDRVGWYEDFSDRVATLKATLVDMLQREKSLGKRIACYGAAAKGATLLNYLDLGPGFFEFVADANPFKHGKFMPGQRVPICHPDRLLADQPDLVLLLTWNFAGEILRQQAAYRKAGGAFVIPIPTPRLIAPDEEIAESTYALHSGARTSVRQRSAAERVAFGLA